MLQYQASQQHLDVHYLEDVCYQLSFIQYGAVVKRFKTTEVSPGGQTSPLQAATYRAGSHVKRKIKDRFFQFIWNSGEQKYEGNTEILNQVTLGSTPADIRHQQYQEESPGKAVQAAGLQTALPGVTGCPYPCHLSPQASDSFGSKRRKQPQAQAGIQGALSVCSQRQRLMQLHCEAERQLFCCLYFLRQEKHGSTSWTLLCHADNISCRWPQYLLILTSLSGAI